MTDVVVFHHAQGRTSGVEVFADHLRAAGHTVTVPDLYEGAVFSSLDAGLAHAQEIGIPVILERGRQAVENLPAALVHIGFSLGVLPAQMLAQTRPGARAAVLCGSCVPASEFGGWPDGVPVQVHGMDADPIFIGEGDLEAARALVVADVHLYPGDRHLFADSSLPDYVPAAADLFRSRVLSLLDAC